MWFVQHECQRNTLSTAHSTIEVILLHRNHNGKTVQPLQRSGSYILKIHLEAVICKERPGHVAQSVTCLATDAWLTADPGVASLIPARYHTFVEIDQEIISTVILLPSADLFKKGCCQLQAKVCAQITG